MYPPRSLRLKVWRAAMLIFHRPPIHPGWRHPLRFHEFGCILCRWAFRDLRRRLPPEPFADESQIKVSEPEYDADGKLVRRGISMSATVKRQLDEILADPKRAEAVQKAIDDIARDP